MAFEIGSVIARIKADSSDFQQGIKDVTKQTNAFGNVVKKIGGVIATTFAVSKIVTFGKQASEEAMNLEKAMISLEIISGKFGVSATEAQDAAKKLGKELRIGVGSAAESLQNLLKSGLNLPQAVELMKRFTNEAITGKSANISLAQAVQNLSFAYATGNSALGNMSGISENWIDITNRGREALIKEGVAVNTITDEMAKFRGIMDLTNLTLGSSERFHGTLIDKQAELGQTVVDLKVKVGELLNPQIAILTDKFNGVLKEVQNLIGKIPELTGFYEEHKNTINGVVEVLTLFFIPAIIKSGIEAGITATVGMAKLIASVISFGLEGWKAIAMLIVKSIQLGIATAAIILHTTVTIAQTIATGALTAATWLLNAALAVLTSPIFLVVAAIVALIAIGVLLYKNWDVVKEKASQLWEYVKKGFNDIVTVLGEIGGRIFSKIKEPFEKAWGFIQDIANKIKDKLRWALDPEKKSSPSLVDRINHGVNEINKAFERIDIGLPQMSKSYNLLGVGQGINGMSINIDLSGAYIGDDSIGEKIGDAIISKLQKNVRF